MSVPSWGILVLSSAPVLGAAGRVCLNLAQGLFRAGSAELGCPAVCAELAALLAQAELSCSSGSSLQRAQGWAHPQKGAGAQGRSWAPEPVLFTCPTNLPLLRLKEGFQSSWCPPFSSILFFQVVMEAGFFNSFFFFFKITAKV